MLASRPAQPACTEFEAGPAQSCKSMAPTYWARLLLGSTGTLVLKISIQFTGTISGISGSGDVLDVAGFDTNATLKYNGTTTGAH